MTKPGEIEERDIRLVRNIFTRRGRTDIVFLKKIVTFYFQTTLH